MRIKTLTLLFLLSTVLTLYSFALPAEFSTQAQSPLYTTRIEGRVIDADTQQPISNALVTLSAFNIHLMTDNTGRFQMTGIALATEHAVIEITVEAEGYGRWIMQNTVLYANITRIFGDITLSNAPKTIDAGGLPGASNRDPEAILRSMEGFTPPSTLSPSFFSHDIIPSTIRVGITGYLHCRDWLNAGQPVERVEEMLFSDYVKGVLPNEWVSAWPIESLKSGAVAIKMFAWWRINLDADGIRPGGAHVVNNTCDQVFIENSQQSVTNAAVDDTWNHIMRDNGRVVEIHYLNTDENCARYFPNVRCMGQWGTKYLADEGFTWEAILHNYYDPIQITLGDSNLPALPTNTNVIRNGDFSNELREWSTFGETGWALYDGILGIKSEAADDVGGIRQNIPYAMQAGSQMEISLWLGNSSPVTKTPSIFVRNSSNPDEYFACEFSVPPNTPLQRYTVYGQTGNWSIPRLEIWPDPPDNQPDLLVDEVSLYYRPALNLSGTQCFSPTDNTHWTFTQNPQGWSIIRDLNNPRMVDGTLHMDVTGTIPVIDSPTLLNTNAEGITHVVMQMASDVDSCAAVYFQKAGQRVFLDTQRMDFDIIPDGTIRSYLIPIAESAEWSGQITGIRLALGCNGNTGGTIRLQSVLLADTRTMPILQSPSGIIADIYGNPTYTWQHLSGTTAYQLYVARASGQQVFYDFINSDTHCTDALCRVDLTTLGEQYRLQNGDYIAYMRAWTNNSPGDWSIGYAFTLNAPALLPVSLTNTTNLSSARPTFNWELPSGADGASWFRVIVLSETTPAQVYLDRWFTRIESCGDARATRCGLTSPVDLNSGTYSLYIQSWGAGGLSQGGLQGFAGPGRFTIAGAIPTLPENLTIDPKQGRPTLTWTDDAISTWVQLRITHADGNDIYNQWHEKTPQLCDGTQCQLTPEINPTNGEYQVFIRTWGAGGVSSWGGPIRFSYMLPAPSVITDANAENANTGQPTFTWQGVANALWYNLSIIRGESGTVIYDTWHLAADLGCETAGQCTLAPRLNLTNGSYQWQLKAWGPGGLGQVMPAQRLLVNALPTNTPNPLTPSQITYLPQPTFIWTAVTDASWYQLEVSSESGTDIPLYNGWHNITELVCDTQRCSFVLPDVNFAPGNYRWRVLAYSPGGLGAWSIALPFTVQ